MLFTTAAEAEPIEQRADNPDVQTPTVGSMGLPRIRTGVPPVMQQIMHLTGVADFHRRRADTLQAVVLQYAKARANVERLAWAGLGVILGVLVMWVLR